MYNWLQIYLIYFFLNIFIRAVKTGNPTRPDPTRLDLSRVDDLVSQPNPAHFLASQKNLNPARLTTGWRVKRVDSRVDLIKKIFLYFFFSVKTKL